MMKAFLLVFSILAAGYASAEMQRHQCTQKEFEYLIHEMMTVPVVGYDGQKYRDEVLKVFQNGGFQCDVIIEAGGVVPTGSTVTTYEVFNWSMKGHRITVVVYRTHPWQNTMHIQRLN